MCTTSSYAHKMHSTYRESIIYLQSRPIVLLCDETNQMKLSVQIPDNSNYICAARYHVAYLQLDHRGADASRVVFCTILHHSSMLYDLHFLVICITRLHVLQIWYQFTKSLAQYESRCNSICDSASSKDDRITFEKLLLNCFFNLLGNFATTAQ